MANTVIETVELRMPDEESAASYILERLDQRGFQAGSDVGEAVRKAAAQVIAGEKFAGFRSLDTVVEEVVWHKMSQEGKCILLNVQDFNDLTCTALDGSVPKHTSSLRKIGFGQNR